MCGISLDRDHLVPLPEQSIEDPQTGPLTDGNGCERPSQQFDPQLLDFV